MRASVPPAFRELAVILLLLAGIMPVALAARSTGELTVASILIPKDARSGVQFLGLIDNDAKNMTGEIRAPELTLCRYEAHFAEVSNPDPVLRAPLSATPAQACYPLTSVTVTIRGGAGWIGSRSIVGGTADITSLAQGIVTPHGLSTLASTGGRIAGSDDNGKPRFTQVVSGPHLLYETALRVVYRGDDETRLMGPTAHVASAENETDIQTGEEVKGGTVTAHERIMRWVVLQSQAATVTLNATSPILLAARDAPLFGWDGNATLTAPRGVIHAETATYESAGNSAFLEGNFTGTLAPTSDDSGDSAALHVEGDLRGTSLQTSGARVPVASGGRPFPWVPILVGAAVVSSAIAAMRSRRHPRPILRSGGAAARALRFAHADSTDLEIYENRADELADSYSWLSAADAYRKVRRLDPARPRVAMKEGVCLFMAGRYRTALASFEDAALLADDGDAEYWAARCLVRLGLLDHAEARLLDGLKRHPTDETLDPIETDGDLAIIRDRAPVRAALDAAWLRLP